MAVMIRDRRPDETARPRSSILRPKALDREDAGWRQPPVPPPIDVIAVKSDALKDLLCHTFCSEHSVSEVPAGLAFSGVFEDALGDRIAGYLVQDQGAQYLSDDGAFLADLDAANVAVFDGARAAFLERVLTPANAFADPETFEIRTHAFEGSPQGARS